MARVLARRAAPRLTPSQLEQLHAVQDPLAAAAEARGWFVHWYDGKRVFRAAEAALGCDDIDAFLRTLGKAIGPPWQAKQKLAAAAAFFPAHLGDKADPFASAPVGIKPEWYFMFTFQTLKYLPAHILWIIEGEILGILAFTALGIFMLLVPIYDPEGRGHRSRIVTRVGIGLVVYMIVLTAIGYLSNPSQ